MPPTRAAKREILAKACDPPVIASSLQPMLLQVLRESNPARRVLDLLWKNSLRQANFEIEHATVRDLRALLIEASDGAAATLPEKDELFAAVVQRRDVLLMKRLAALLSPRSDEGITDADEPGSPTLLDESKRDNSRLTGRRSSFALTLRPSEGNCVA